LKRSCAALITPFGVVEPGGRADLTVLDVTHAPQPADLARIHAVVRDGVPIWSAG
jgi:imidazolonepropionase-like amidohydrolase